MATSRFFASPPNPLNVIEVKGMRVRFNQDIRWAHKNQQQGQFQAHSGDIVEGICEEDATQIQDLGYGTIMGTDDSENNSDDNDNNDDSSDDNNNKDKKEGNSFPQNSE